MVGLWLLPVMKGYIVSRVSIFQRFDLTLLFTLLIFGLCITKHKNWSRLKTKYVRSFLICQAILVLLMSISLAWTDAPEYGFSKTMKFAVFSLVAFVSPLLLLDNQKDLRRYFYALIFTACFVSLVVIFAPSFQTTSAGVVSNRTSAFESNPLNPAFFIAVAASICFLLPKKVAVISKTCFGAIFLLLQYSIFLTSSRSMFAQAFLALSIWALLTKSNLRWIFRTIVVIAVIGIPAYIISDATLANSRVGESLADPLNAYAESGRRFMWEYCFRNWINRPFLGHGIGSFAVDFFGEDSRNFPHNIFLEALYELGLSGLFALSAIFFIVARATWKYKKAAPWEPKSNNDKDLAIIWFSAVAAATLSISLHWDLADNRLLWNMFGCMFLITLLPPEGSWRGRYMRRQMISPQLYRQPPAV